MLTILKTLISSFLHLLAICAKIVYNVLKFLRIRLLALYLLVCGILYLIFGEFSGAYQTLFWVGFAFFLLCTLLAWAKRFHGRGKKKRLEEERDRERERTEDELAASSFEKEPSPSKKQKKKQPVYYEVEGKPDYIFAEFDDRFELYRRSGDELKIVRVDYKESQDD